MAPFFLDGPTGRLFAIDHHPAAARSRSAALFVPSFAEEMNRCRRMASEQAKDLSRAGIGALLIDLFGTGDSEGEFRDADWEAWRQDIGAAVGWLHEQGIERVVLIGTRLGALLALDFARKAPNAIERLVLWQPVLRGRQMIDQMIRVRLAGTLALPTDRRDSAQRLRAAVAAGQPLHLAGYELNARLVMAIEALDIAELAPPAGVAIDWLEVRDDGEISPASRRVIGSWRETGVDVAADAVPGPPFWMLLDITVAPALIARTTDRLTHLTRDDDRDTVRISVPG